MDPTLLLIPIVGLALLAYSYGRKQGLLKAWYAYAHQRNLHVNRSPRLSGISNNVEISVEIITKGDSKNRVTYTEARAAFRIPLPHGLFVREQTSSFSAFFNSDLEVGLPKLDDDALISGSDSAGIRRYLNLPGVAPIVREFIRSGHASIGSDCAVFWKKGTLKQPRELDSLIGRVTRFVNKLESEIMWDPNSELIAGPLPRPQPFPVPVQAPATKTERPVAQGLIASLKSQGRVESRGEFSMDRVTAWRRLRDHASAEPARYVLEWMQAAVWRGATRIEIDAGSRFTMRFDGEFFAAHELQELETFAFLHADDDTLRSRQALAVGMAWALGEGAKELRVTSGSSQLTAEPGELAEFSELSEAIDGTEIEVRTGLLGRSFGGSSPENRILKQRARYSVVRVLLNEERITRDWPLEAEGATVIERDGFHVRAGLIQLGYSRAQVHLTRAGMVIETVVVDWAPAGFVAAVESDLFQTDLSRAAMVRDEAYATAMVLAAEAEVTVFENICRESDPAQTPEWVTSAIRKRIYLLDDLSEVREGGQHHHLAWWPVWLTICGELVSTAAILNASGAGDKVFHCDFALPAGFFVKSGFDLDHTLLVNWQSSSIHRAAVARLFASSLRSGTKRLKRLVSEAQARPTGAASPAPD